ncbi:transposase (plasmid) [Curtobacterium flaccumfaciens pv. flaccumfaciens]|nr:transposase [Curtobacterium flaccumfaciens pv. flaccumfaciens]
MLDHEREFGLRSMYKVFGLHPSGYYAWRSKPMSPRAKDDARVLGLIKQSWLESGGVYGYRKITRDLRDLGESCGKHRTARLMRQGRPCGAQVVSTPRKIDPSATRGLWAH